MLNPVHLTTLTAVVRSGSFADAARKLGYTGSAVSQQMSALERQLRTTLFERDAHGVRATPAAEFIVARCSSTLGALQSLEDDVAIYLGGALGTLRLGSFPTASEHLLPRALSSFKVSNPGVEVLLQEAEPARLIARLQSREVDVALLYRYNLAPVRWPRHLEVTALTREELVLLQPARTVSSSPRADTVPAESSRSARFDGLQDRTWICTGEETAGAAVLRHLARAEGFDPIVSLRSDNYSVIQGLVRAGLGLALVPALGYVPDPAVTATPLDGTPAFREVVVAWSPTVQRPLVHAFTTALRRAARHRADASVGVSYVPRRAPDDP